MGHPSSLQFVTFAGDPSCAAAKGAKKAVVRRQAANAVHSRVRRERVLQHQRAKDVEDEKPTRWRSSPSGPSRGDEKAHLAAGGATGTTSGLSRWAAAPSPRSFLSPSHVDPFHTGARPLSTFESFLLNHYAFDVIAKSAERCSPVLPPLPHYASEMRGVLLPLALSNAGLLATVLLAACRSLSGSRKMLPADGGARGGFWSVVGWRYKGEAIALVRERVAAEGENVSEATLGMVLMLAADEVVDGNVAVLRVHADAIVRIIRLRGGLENLGFSSFMKQLIAWFLEDPERRDVPCLLPAVDATDRVSAAEMMAMSAINSNLP